MLLQPLVLGAVTGLASTAHCAAMCGPLAASACAQRAARGSLVRYQAGRTAGYALLGAIAGGLGHAISLTSISPWLGYSVPAMTALSLLLLARRLVRPRSALVQLGSRTAHAPASSLFGWLARYAPADPIAIGALTALLPCAALAAAVLLAASSQTRAGGAALMIGFATSSALGVLGGGAVLARLTRLGDRSAARVLATVLACAALYVGLSPLYRELRSQDAHPAHFPSCH